MTTAEKPIKISAGRYALAGVTIVRRAPRTGMQRPSNRETTTWGDEATGKWLGYTLAEALETVRRTQ